MSRGLGHSVLYAVDTHEALFTRHAHAEGESIVAGAAVHVEPIAPERPQSMIGDLGKGTDERVRKTERQEAELPAVRVSAQHQIRLAIGQMPERSGIVEQHEAEVPGEARVLCADIL